MIAEPPVTALVIVADDLSGAAETAGAVAGVTGIRPQLFLGPAPRFDAQVVAIDSHSRELNGRGAAMALEDALQGAPEGVRIFKKIDSLLRGNIAAEMGMLRGAGRSVVVASAVPRIGRTVRGGVVHVGAAPLHTTDLWRAESVGAPASIRDSLGVDSVVLTLDHVRSPALKEHIRSATSRRLVPVCDSETDQDLDRIAEALTALGSDIVAVGAAGLARALAGSLDIEQGEQTFAPDAERVVVVMGSRAQSALAQVDAMLATGIARVVLVPGKVPRLVDGDSIVTLSAQESFDAMDLANAFSALADAIVALPGRTDLVLTGGDTARRTLDALGVVALFPEREIHDGAVLSTLTGGAAVVTRPGSYGGRNSLIELVRYLKGTP